MQRGRAACPLAKMVLYYKTHLAVRRNAAISPVAWSVVQSPPLPRNTKSRQRLGVEAWVGWLHYAGLDLGKRRGGTDRHERIAGMLLAACNTDHRSAQAHDGQ